jgi:hypothetical protein
MNGCCKQPSGRVHWQCLSVFRIYRFVAKPPARWMEKPMVEFMRSATIVLMGLVVLGAGVVVVFFG